MKTVAYLRVSTAQQDVRSQRLAILEYARKHDFRIDDFIEATASGQASEKRRRLDELTSILQRGDRLVVSELSRLGRSLGQIVAILDAFAKAGVAFVALKENICVEGRRDIQTKVMTTLFALFAEVERDLISERTREGLARARSSGRKLGRPKGSLGVSRLDGVLAVCCRPRRTGRRVERDDAALRRGLVDGAIVALVFHGALRRSEVAALRWTDVDLSVGDDIVGVTVPGSKTNPSADEEDVRQLVGGCAAALRRLHAATKPAPANSVVGLGVHQITRRFSAACAAAGLEGRRMPHSGRVGLAVELAAAGPPPATCSWPADGRTLAWSRATRPASTPARAPWAGSCGNPPVANRTADQRDSRDDVVAVNTVGPPGLAIRRRKSSRRDHKPRNLWELASAPPFDPVGPPVPAVNPALSVVRPPLPQLVVPDSFALGEELGGSELGKLLRCRLLRCRAAAWRSGRGAGGRLR